MASYMNKKYLIMDYDQEIVLTSWSNDILVWSNVFGDYDDTIKANNIDNNVIFKSLEDAKNMIKYIEQVMLDSGMKQSELDIRPLEVLEKKTFVLTKTKYNLL